MIIPELLAWLATITLLLILITSRVDTGTFMLMALYGVAKMILVYRIFLAAEFPSDPETP